MGYPISGALDGLTKGYINNVSNAEGVSNETTCTAGVDTTTPLLGDGTNNFTAGPMASGKLELDASFNGGLGGIIVDKLASGTDHDIRFTFQNIDGPTTCLVKAFLVFDKTVPGTGVKISTSPIDVRQNVEQTTTISFFDGGIEAIYLQINSEVTRDYQINGVKFKALEIQ
jgi:hypothetical protein